MKYLKLFESFKPEFTDKEISLMHSYYRYAFKSKIFKTIEDAKKYITQIVEWNNKQSSTAIFGKDDVDKILNLYNFIQIKTGIKILPKVRIKNAKKEFVYDTNSTLVNKQINSWSDIRGIEFGRWIDNVKYLNTNDNRIYGTEDVDSKNLLNIIKSLKDGDELPPILLDYDYGILDGHHRYEAAKKLKIKKIPVIIYRYPDEELNEEFNFNTNFNLNQQDAIDKVNKVKRLSIIRCV